MRPIHQAAGTRAKQRNASATPSGLLKRDESVLLSRSGASKGSTVGIRRHPRVQVRRARRTSESAQHGHEAGGEAGWKSRVEKPGGTAMKSILIGVGASMAFAVGAMSSQRPPSK